MAGILEAVMETDGQRNTGPVSDTAGQDSKSAEHMAMDILGLCGILLFYGREPAAADGLQGPGGGPEKVNHGEIAVRRERQVTDNRGHTKLIRPEYKSYSNRNKPTEGSLPGKTGFKIT